jgi:dTDP-4-amino-4,6-dideoxygalactose transaminase
LQIRFNTPCLAGPEFDYVRQAIANAKLSGDGPFTSACESLLEHSLDAGRVLLTTSGTDALELAALLLDIAPGDEVIMPSYTFSSTANAFCLRGARPVFVDIRPDTLNIDETLISDAISERTRAIVPVHYAGVACEMDPISALAETHGLRIVEDAAQGIFSYYKNHALGTLGDVGCFSFHETKTLMSGEGGAICVNREEFESRVEIVREKGSNRAAFFRGEVDKYTWVDIGSSFLPSELTAAFLLAQLEARNAIIAARADAYDFYTDLLSPLREEGLLTLPTVPDHCAISYHMFYVLTDNSSTREALIKYLSDRGITAVFHYVPLHSSPMGRKLRPNIPHLPVTDDIAGRIIRLPLYNSITPQEQEYVANQIYRFFNFSPARVKGMVS